MDSAKYRELVDDIAADISEAEQNLSDLRGVERYVSQKAESQHSYNGLLKEIQNDVAETERTLTELQILKRYVLGKIESPGGTSKPIDGPQPSSEVSSSDDADESAQSNVPPERVVNAASAVKKGPHKGPAKDATQSDAMQTVEFGPDGFPMA